MHVLRPQTTMMDADSPVSDRKTEAHAARGAIARIVYAEERLENLGQQFLGNPRAGITNVNQNRLIGGFHLDVHGSSPRSMPDRVPDNVLHCAAQQFPVSL